MHQRIAYFAKLSSNFFWIAQVLPGEQWGELPAQVSFFLLWAKHFSMAKKCTFHQLTLLSTCWTFEKRKLTVWKAIPLQDKTDFFLLTQSGANWRSWRMGPSEIHKHWNGTHLQRLKQRFKKKCSKSNELTRSRWRPTMVRYPDFILPPKFCEQNFVIKILIVVQCCSLLHTVLDTVQTFCLTLYNNAQTWLSWRHHNVLRSSADILLVVLL